MPSTNDDQKHAVTGSGDETDSTKGPPGAAPCRKCRVLPRALGLVVVLLLAAVALAPTLLSTGPGRNLVLSVANDRLQGTLAADGIKLSWFGRCRAEALKVTDPQGREVLSVDGIDLGGGLWKAKQAMTHLPQIAVESPQVVLYMDEDGRISLAQAFSPQTPSPPDDEEAGPVSIPDGRINISDGTVRVARSDGREYQVSDVQLDIGLGSDGSVDTTLSGTLGAAGKLSGKVAVTGLLSAGRIDLTNAGGTISVQTDEPVDIQPITALALEQGGVTGHLGLLLEGSVESGALTAEWTTDLTGVASAGVAGRPVAPTSMRLAGKVQASNDAISGRMQASGDVGTVTAEASFTPSDRPLSVSTDALRAALLEGQDIDLPQFSLTAQADVDFPALERALPGLLHVREDTEITGGRLAVTKLNVSGGGQPAVEAAVELTGLSAQTASGQIRSEPIELTVDAAVRTAEGLQGKVVLKSAFGHLTANGTPSGMRATLESDLSALQTQLGRFFDFGSAELAGDLFATIEATRAREEDFDFAIQLSGQRLRYATREQELGIQLATFENKGSIALTGRQSPRIEVQNATLDVEGRVQADASGWYDLETGGFGVQADLARTDLSFVGRQMAALGTDALAGYGGNVEAHTRVDRSAKDAPIVSEGNLRVAQPQIDGETLSEQLRAEWSGVEMAPEAGTLKVALAKLESAFANLTAKDVNARLSGETAVDGRIEAAADLAKCAAVAARMGGAKKPPEISGNLSFRTVCRSDAGGFSASGEGAIRDFVVGGDTPSPKENVQFAYDAALDHRSEIIDLRKLNLESGLMSTQVTGRVNDYSKACELALDGQYQIAWGRATQLLHELVPSTAELISFAGDTSGKLTARGPARQPNARPAFRGLNAGADLGWASAEVYGLPLSRAVFKPALADGQLKLPPASIKVAGGSVRLGGELDFRPKELTLRIPGTLTLLKTIKITPQLARELLGRFNPVFSKATRVEGIVDLTVQDLAMPLAGGSKGGSGSGRLELTNAQVQPGGLMTTLIELGGLGKSDMYAVRFSGLDFQVKQGRIHYRDFTMTFADNPFDLKFYGSVGLDDTLDLVVSLPVRPALLTRLGVTGPVTEYAKKRSGTRVDVPIVGTREDPKLDLAKVDKEKLLREVLKQGVLNQDLPIDKKDVTDPKSLLEKGGKLLEGDSKQKKSEGKGGKSKAKGKQKGGLDDLIKGLPGQQQKKKKD